MKLRRTLRRVVVVGACFLGFSIFLAVLLVEIALAPSRRPLFTVPLPGRIEEVQIDSEGVRLHAWYVTPGSINAGSVLLHHGVGDNRLGVVGFARMLVPKGYAVLMVDGRGHGASGGMVTYGLRESVDVARWVRWMRERRAGPVFGLGKSMGAAILLQSLATEAGLAAVVAESPFCSFREIAYDRLGQVFGAGHLLGRTLLRPAGEAGLLYTRWRTGVNPGSASPCEAVRLTRVPVLLIHGESDNNVPVRHSRLIAAANLPHVTLWEVPEAPHTGAYAVRREEFERRVTEFFERASGSMNSFPARKPSW
ncbi:MAG: alpha/beta fold hydrolase [Acidobacteriia bacterium]|nr:alpha/beta fold hydrolase [Terriglobia bacterium]